MKRLMLTLVLVLLAHTAAASTRPLNNALNDLSVVPANVLMPLSGIGTMIAESLPPKLATNDAQAAAVTATVDSAIARGLLPAPSPSCGKVTNCYSLSDYYNFALLFAKAKNAYQDMQPTSPLLFWLRYYLRLHHNPDGSIDWVGVDAAVANLVTTLITPDGEGNVAFKLGTATAAQVVGFAQDLARIVDNYDRA